MTNILAFDLEILDTLPDFAKWKSHRPLTITCAGLAHPEGTETLWSECVIDRYAQPLDKAGLSRLLGALRFWLNTGATIVTWNGLGFDFVLLADASGEYDLCREIALSDHHVDLMFNVYMALGYNTPLSTTCKETIGKGKLDGMSGGSAPELWQKGEHELVLDYAREDAVITRDLYLHLQETPTIKWRTKRGRGAPRQLRANRRWHPLWSVAKMLEAEPPEVPRWMTNKPITLKSFLEEWNV